MRRGQECDGRDDKIPSHDPNPLESVAAPSFRDVFDTHYDYVWNSLRRLGVFPADLEDVTHEVFVRVHQHLSSYEPARPMRPWLFAFAFHAGSDYRRLARHRANVELDAVDPVDQARDPEEQLSQHEAMRLVDEALQAISLTNRAVFVMYEIDGASMKEIANALEVPLHTAYSRLRLARSTFEAKVRELQGEDAR